jgi:peptidoglycan/LPS O-acetylase OafA/YrhL
MRERLDAGPTAAGAVVGAAGLALVGAVAGVTDVGDDDGQLAVVIPLVLVAVGGLAVAGWVAASRSRRAPLVHAATAAVAAVLVAEVLVVVRQLVTDESIAWASGLAWLLLAVAAGLAGGLRALRPRRRADSPG